MFTEAQLKSKSKETLVEMIVNISNQLAAAQSGPLKASDIEKTLLDLQRQTISVQDNAVKRQQSHEEEMKKLDNSFKLASQKLELEFQSEEGSQAGTLADTYKALEAAATKATADLSFGLKQAEIETQQSIDDLQARLAKVTEDYQSQIDAWNEKVITAKTNASTQVAQVQTDHTRDLEQIQYDNKKALRDENLAAAQNIAKALNMTVVDNTELASLKDFKATDIDDVQIAVESAVKATTSSVYASEGAKYSALKSSTDNQIALLTKDKDYLTNDLKKAETRIAELTAQLNLVPSQIKEAVGAARADISVTQDAKGK